jgi:pimeloyl-ACP methyl ester carboxylesterase
MKRRNGAGNLMNYRRSIHTFACVLWISILSVLPAHGAGNGTRTIVKSDGIDIEVFEFGNGNDTLTYAPGHENLAAVDAEQGEYPALAAAQVKASDATPPEEWATGGTAPMLVMTCLLDVVAVPQSARSIAKSRPNAWLVGLPGCGHNMLYERGDDLVWLMSDFILRTSRHP